MSTSEAGSPAPAVPAPGSHAAGAPVPSPFADMAAAVERGIGRGLKRATYTALAPYQSAMIRIGISLTWLLYLLREWPHRAELYGPNSPWSFDLGKRLLAGNHAFTVLMWSDSRTWFEFVYAVAIVSSAMLLLGWRTRTASVLFMIGVLSLQNRSVFVGDGGDNVIHLMAIYLAFTRCGKVWSLDRRRALRQAEAAARAEEAAAAKEAASAEEAASAGDVASAGGGEGAGKAAATSDDLDLVGVALWVVLGAALVAAALAGKFSSGWALIFWACWAGQAVWWAVRRYAPGEPRTVLDIAANVVHNGALLVICVEVCLIYSTAGWYKIQGSRWQDGTAPYYPLHLDDFTPWPALSHALGHNGTLIMIICYGTVIAQVAFPFTLFNRRVKNVLLATMMMEHLSIAITLGLPIFSLAMISADSVFLPTNFLRWAADRLVGLVRPRRSSALPVIHQQRAAAANESESEAESAPPGAVTDPA